MIAWFTCWDRVPLGPLTVTRLLLSTVTVTPAPLSAKDLATQTLTNMKARGFTVSEPVASGDSYVGEFSKDKAKGISYFCSNGKIGSVITIVGASVEAGKKLLKDNFKPLDSKLFPSAF